MSWFLLTISWKLFKSIGFFSWLSFIDIRSICSCLVTPLPLLIYPFSSQLSVSLNCVPITCTLPSSTLIYFRSVIVVCDLSFLLWPPPPPRYWIVKIEIALLSKSCTVSSVWLFPANLETFSGCCIDDWNGQIPGCCQFMPLYMPTHLSCRC